MPAKRKKQVFFQTEEEEDPQEEEAEGAQEFYYSSPDGYIEELIEEDPYEDNYKSDGDYGYEYFNSMQLYECPDDKIEATTDGDDDSYGCIHSMQLYELSDDKMEVSTTGPHSVKLPIYDVTVNNDDVQPGIIDSGATTLYLSPRLVKKANAKIKKVRPRKIKIADKDTAVVNTIATIEIKVGGLPVETVTGYIFPLKDIDIVLGLPWLQKHNPHTDWRKFSYEFVRNGRRYELYPARPSKSLKIVPAEEFNAFIEDEDETALFTLIPETYHGEDPEPPKDPQSIAAYRPSRTERRALERERKKMMKWIETKHKNLLRSVGKPAKLEPFVIDTGDAEPIKISPRPYSPVDLQKIKEFINENLENGIIRESDSPWSAPIVLAIKADGTTRVCVDYRALNRVTKKDAYPLPRIDESFSQFHGARYFTTLDLKSGYWQILLDPESRAKTAFSTRYGHYEWRVLPFGVCNGPGGFQKRINRLLVKFIDVFVIVYMDDILIYSRTLKEHVEHIRQVLQVLSEADMILNIEKCKFFQFETRFLGHILSRYGSRPDPRHIEKILNWPTPRTITDVRGFNNLASHHKRYIVNFATIVMPLTDLMKGSPAKGTSIIWTIREEKAFRALKKPLQQNLSFDILALDSHFSLIRILHNVASAVFSNNYFAIQMARCDSILLPMSRKS